MTRTQSCQKPEMSVCQRIIFLLHIFQGIHCEQVVKVQQQRPDSVPATRPENYDSIDPLASGMFLVAASIQQQQQSKQSSSELTVALIRVDKLWAP